MLSLGALGLSLALLLYASLRALRLTRVTGWRSPWMALAVVALLQAFRRASTIVAILSEGPDDSVHLLSAIVTLAISIGMLVVVETIGPVFQHMEGVIRQRTRDLDATNEELAATNEELEATNEELAATNQELDAINEELQDSNRQLVETQAVLEHANTQLRDTQAIKDRLVANISHELRTPLSSVIGFSDLMLRGMTGSLNEEQQRQIGMINEGGKHLLDIINDILSIERADAGMIELDLLPVALDDVVGEAAALMEPLATEKGLRLVVGSSACVGFCDRQRTLQILINLLSNAIKFTDSGEVGISVTTDSGTVRLAVSDTGRGIDSADFDRAFTEFVQLDGDVVDRPQGTGLGLALSRRLARLQGGDVELRSERGRGSTFTLVIPEASA